jgi:hypothetical protein
MRQDIVDMILALEAEANEQVGQVDEIDLTDQPELYVGAVNLVRASRLRAMEIEANEQVEQVGGIDLTKEPELCIGAVDLVRASRLRAMAGKPDSPAPVSRRWLLYGGLIAAGVASLVAGVITHQSRVRRPEQNVAKVRDPVVMLDRTGSVGEQRGARLDIDDAFSDAMLDAHWRIALGAIEEKCNLDSVVSVREASLSVMAFSGSNVHVSDPFLEAMLGARERFALSATAAGYSLGSVAWVRVEENFSWPSLRAFLLDSRISIGTEGSLAEISLSLRADAAGSAFDSAFALSSEGDFMLSAASETFDSWFRVEPKGSFARLTFSVGSSPAVDGGDLGYFDDFSITVTETPEPSPIGIFSLGAAAIIIGFCARRITVK